MAQNSAKGLLTSVDSLFTTQAERDDAKLTRVEEIPIDLIDDFPNHPYKVRMDDSGTLIINGTTQGGEIMYPTYAKEGMEYPYRVPEGNAFLLGDYRTQTEDSRDFGPVPLNNIQGKVITIVRRRGV